jgi:hypothetical protein
MINPLTHWSFLNKFQVTVSFFFLWVLVLWCQLLDCIVWNGKMLWMINQKGFEKIHPWPNRSTIVVLSREIKKTTFNYDNVRSNWNSVWAPPKHQLVSTTRPTCFIKVFWIIVGLKDLWFHWIFNELKMEWTVHALRYVVRWFVETGFVPLCMGQISSWQLWKNYQNVSLVEAQVVRWDSSGTKPSGEWIHIFLWKEEWESWIRYSFFFFVHKSN